MYRYATINGIDRYPECIFDSSEDFESFAEYWNATIKTEYGNSNN
jgi:hypothetical protein